jgi:hypothetical protein
MILPSVNLPALLFYYLVVEIQVSTDCL